MRSKKALLNTVIALLEEVVSIICGFILPRLILENFGSEYNGLATSITQFLRCAVLLRAGIGGATRAALYKPLAEHDKGKVDRILRATDLFMHKIAMILAALIVVTACIYPFIVDGSFEWWFVASLVLIIGISAFAESYFGITYQILLQADQRTYVFSVVKIGAVIANTAIAAALIKCGASLHGVQLGNALAYAAIPVIIHLYVRRTYQISTRVEPDMTAISQRWDAFAQQAATFMMNNAGVMVVTFFAQIAEVSVYTVYNMVITALNRVLTSITSGIEAAFGNIIAKGETESLNRNFDVVEFLVFMVTNVLCACSAALILPFVGVYTKGVTDVNYIRPVFAYTLLLSGFFNAVRLPYQLVVQAAGHYRQTRNGAILEAGLNIGLSSLLVYSIGLEGAAIGVLCATLVRTVQYTWYSSRKILRRRLALTLRNYACSAVFALVSLAVLSRVLPNECSGYGGFVVQGFISVAVCGAVALLMAAVFYRRALGDCIAIAKRLLVRKQKGKEAAE